MSVAAEVRDAVERSDRRSFLRAADLPGSGPAVFSELSRLTAAGELVRVQKGLYYRPPARGRRRPPPLQTGLAIGGRGAGPAGVSAARMFGVTTQVPATETVAVPGRAPADRDGVRFVSRSFTRRELGLTAYEAGLLEVLRDFDSVCQEPFSGLVDVVARAVADGKIRPERVRQAAEDEWDVATRRRWRWLEERLSGLELV